MAALNMNQNFVFAEGGTGGRILIGLRHVLDSLALAEGGGTRNWKTIYETMDAAGSEIEELGRLEKLNRELKDFRKADCSYTFLDLSKYVKTRMPENTNVCLREIAPEWYHNGLIFTREELERDLSGGYYRDMVLYNAVAPIAMECALRSPEDKEAGFQAVADSVINANHQYEVRAVFAGNGGGGEGRGNLSRHPAELKELCVKRATEELHLSLEQAEAYVEQNLKIAVVMVGSVFRFPASEELDQDVAGLVAGTMRNYPEDASRAVNLFYILEHDCCPVQAEQPSLSGCQFKHAHAIELVAAAAIEDFFSRDRERVSKRGCPVYPHYSMPGRGLTNWANLGLPETWRIALSARLRFDAALFYWAAPQLLVSEKERTEGMLYESEILRAMVGVKNARQAEEKILGSEFSLDDEIIRPMKALMERETLFLRYLSDICQTGKNWETGAAPAPGCGTELFELSRIRQMLEDPVISRCGGMTGFQFDELTRCPENHSTGKTEENLFYTKLTMDRLRKNVVRSCRGSEKEKPFNEVLFQIYDLCSDRKEAKTWRF